MPILPAHCRVYPPGEVTTRNTAAECEPREAELSRAAVDAIWASVVALYKGGLHPAIALCLRRRGRVVIDRAIGHLRGNAPGAAPGGVKPPVTPGSLFNLFSASKCVTAMLAHTLEDRGLVHLDDPVSEYVPEFARGGKHDVTIRQILTHRAGIPTLRKVAIDIELLTDRERLMRMLYELSPVAPPGRKLAYHALTGGFVIDEIVRRVTGGDLQVLLDETVRRPLGMRGFRYGVPREELGNVAEHAFTGLPPHAPYSWMLRRALGVDPIEAVAISNDPRFLGTVVPSGNLTCTADEACRFFELLLRGGELGGVRVFSRKTVRRALLETSWLEVDTFLGFPVRYGSGFMLGGKLFSAYGPDTELAFGHVGFSNVITWADPERDLSGCLMTSGKPFVTPGQLRWWNVMRTIAGRCGKLPPAPAG